jgi:hypothetical protein
VTSDLIHLTFELGNCLAVNYCCTSHFADGLANHHHEILEGVLKMIVKLTLVVEWELGKQGMVLDGMSDHYSEPVEEIR